MLCLLTFEFSTVTIVISIISSSSSSSMVARPFSMPGASGAIGANGATGASSAGLSYNASTHNRRFPGPKHAATFKDGAAFKDGATFKEGAIGAVLKVAPPSDSFLGPPPLAKSIFRFKIGANSPTFLRDGYGRTFGVPGDSGSFRIPG